MVPWDFSPKLQTLTLNNLLGFSVWMYSRNLKLSKFTRHLSILLFSPLSQHI